ncbi:TPR repeat-containing protein [Methylobacterium sp. 4-46]|uniref:tetratricopeptide repeat protein n=1 Tax=unclassified Methylobacterium TaxID=2615210 RepID=UPI000152D1BB|nr:MULTISPECIES: tetratricopeptide repeat protein [Methylobacterium]ACA15536.1 TPR repeat-containing protein [Methylobacterium sp. 4-46]WFT81255.1 tetratricopeptide repeat protein [Methylobacterium nodulans]
MIDVVQWSWRPFGRALIATTAASVLSVGSGAIACPLGSHDSPRVRLLHTLLQPRPSGATAEIVIAPAQNHAHPRPPARNELGTYSHDLPKGAAAPTSSEPPPLYDNLGRLTWPEARPAHAEAAAYFDQAYRLAWAFNHAEAARAFRAAQVLDPSCAMCFWGEAWVLGPHINFPIEADANARALVALDEAKRLAPSSGPVGAALITALAKRYSPDDNVDRRSLDHAYADEMKGVQARFPESPEVALLTADALMNLSPWDYWTDNGRTPKGEARRMIELIEGVLGESQVGALVPAPDHPGAIHLYIHAVEASDRPERAVPHAERLADLMPGAGHIVHMPSHIWYRVGRWRESLDANLQAAAVDEALIRRGGASLLYSEAYYAHNVHFLLASATMGGDGQTALAAAEKLAGMVSDRAKREVPWSQPIAAAPYSAHARFSSPSTILALPAPDANFPLVRANWHYARGVALARLGRGDQARSEAAEIRKLAQRPEIAALVPAGVPAPDVLAIAAKLIEARVAQNARDHARSAALFREAAAIQELLPYMEPPFWYYPVHQSLGAALLAQGRLDEAEAAFRTALRHSPNNGWASAGLLRVAEARGDRAAASEAERLIKSNWFGGDVPALDRL